MKIILGTTRAILTIPVPDNYPSTDISNRHKILFEARIIKQDNNHIFLDEFRILPRQMDTPLTQSESIMLKGLGKRSLCVGLPIILNYWRLANTTSFALSAESGNIPNYDEKVQQYINLGKDNLLKILPKSSFIQDIFDELSVDELAAILARYEANLNLANYYQSLGFEIVSSDLGKVIMSTTVGKFMNSCQNLYLGRNASFNDILMMIQSGNVTGFYLVQISDSPNSLMIVYDKTGNIYTVEVFYNKEDNDIYPPV